MSLPSREDFICLVGLLALLLHQLSSSLECPGMGALIVRCAWCSCRKQMPITHSWLTINSTTKQLHVYSTRCFCKTGFWLTVCLYISLVHREKHNQHGLFADCCTDPWEVHRLLSPSWASVCPLISHHSARWSHSALCQCWDEPGKEIWT